MSFYVTLPSNVSRDSTPSHYRVTLQKPLHLDGDWEVALSEITILRTIKTINDESMKIAVSEKEVNVVHEKWIAADETNYKRKLKWSNKVFTLKYNRHINRFQLRGTDGMLDFSGASGRLLGFEYGKRYATTNGVITAPNEPEGWYVATSEPIISFYYKVGYTWNGKRFVSREYKIPQGYYNNAEKLATVINNVFRHKCLTYNPHSNRFTSTGDYILLNGLHNILGFPHTFITKDEEGKYPPSLNRGVYALYVYSNICEYSLVGDTQVPLLRAVPLQSSKKYGDVENTVFINPMYVGLSANFIDSIEVDIRDDTGKSIAFEEGRTVVVLHFRHKQ